MRLIIKTTKTMNKYYEVQVKIIQENGKKQKEIYLVSASSIHEAEEHTYQDFKGVSLNWEISSVKESKICKVLPPNK